MLVLVPPRSLTRCRRFSTANERKTPQENAPPIPPTHPKNSRSNTSSKTIASCLSKPLVPYKSVPGNSVPPTPFGHNPRSAVLTVILWTITQPLFFDLLGVEFAPINVGKCLHERLQNRRRILLDTEQIIFAKVLQHFCNKGRFEKAASPVSS